MWRTSAFCGEFADPAVAVAELEGGIFNTSVTTFTRALSGALTSPLLAGVFERDQLRALATFLLPLFASAESAAHRLFGKSPPTADELLGEVARLVASVRDLAPGTAIGVPVGWRTSQSGHVLFLTIENPVASPISAAADASGDVPMGRAGEHPENVPRCLGSRLLLQDSIQICFRLHFLSARKVFERCLYFMHEHFDYCVLHPFARPSGPADVRNVIITNVGPGLGYHPVDHASAYPTSRYQASIRLSRVPTTKIADESFLYLLLQNSAAVRCYSSLAHQSSSCATRPLRCSLSVCGW